jgi:hypothetical protein
LSGRQLSRDSDCAAKREKLLIFIVEREVMAMCKGFSHGAHVTDIRSASLKTSAAMLSMLEKLHHIYEFSAESFERLGSAMTAAD